MAFQVFPLSGTVPWNGTLYRYRSFRTHVGGVPWFRLTYSEEFPGSGNSSELRFALADATNTQQTVTVSFRGSQELGVLKTFGQLRRGRYQVVCRSSRWDGAAWRSWRGDLGLNVS